VSGVGCRKKTGIRYQDPEDRNRNQGQRDKGKTDGGTRRRGHTQMGRQGDAEKRGKEKGKRIKDKMP